MHHLFLSFLTTYKLCFTQNKEATVCSMAIEVKMISTATSYYITYTLMQTDKERTNHTTVNLDSHT
jgi:hypothetical protein